MGWHEKQLAELAARTDGVTTRAAIVEAGLTDEQVDTRLASGLLVPVHRGVLRHAAARPSWPALLRAALVACGATAVASHRTAAVLWQLRGVRSARPEITVTGTTRPKLAGVRVHRTNLLEPVDVVSDADGLRRTALPRTLLDLGAVVPPEVVADATEDAVVRSLTTLVDLLCVLERVGGRGRRGAAALRAVVRAGLPDDRLESVLEHRLHRLILGAGVPPPVLQHEVVCDDGRITRLDFAWPGRRIAVEADGRRWHSTSAQFERDMERSNSIGASGWQHYRYGWTAVHERSSEVRRELQQVLAPAA